MKEKIERSTKLLNSILEVSEENRFEVAAKFQRDAKVSHYRYDYVSINESLGEWIRNSIALSYDNGFGKVKLSATNIIDTYKDLFEKKDSPYYVGEGNDTTMFNVYNAFTQQITDDKRDIMNKVEKTLLIKDILGSF